MSWLFRKRTLLLILTVSLLFEPVLPRRSGGGGFSRGSSGARGGSLGRGRSGGGGIFGGGSRSSSHAQPHYGGSRTSSGGGFFGGSSKPKSNQGKSGGFFSSFGSGNKQRSPMTSAFRSGSGLGSRSRSSTFKNMLVGAAAGYLTYQAGKHLIRSAMSPMMWNNRNYYWGSNYYQQRPNMQMCRMPISGNDPTFGDVYFNDYSRPKELVWSCGYHETCCGYECCPGGGGYGGYGGGGYGGGGYGGGGYGSYWGRNGYSGIGIGSLLIFLLLGGAAFYIIYRVCANARSGNYVRGNAT